jgi:hypothetical protein
VFPRAILRLRVNAVKPNVNLRSSRPIAGLVALMLCSKSQPYVAGQQNKKPFEKMRQGSLLNKPASLLGKFLDFEPDRDQDEETKMGRICGTLT